MKVYIAGPMRGLPGCNFAAFHDAERRWRVAGHHPFSPARVAVALGYAVDNPTLEEEERFRGDPDKLRHVILSDVLAISQAEALALLPGWERSVGTTVEVAVAQFLGLPIYHAVSMQPLDLSKVPWSGDGQDWLRVRSTLEPVVFHPIT